MASRRLPMFPLSAVLFPGAELPLHVFEPRYRALMDDCLAGDGCFGVVLIARGSEVGGGDERFGAGTVARITATSPFDDGRVAVLSVGTQRFRVGRWLDDDPYPVAEVELLTDGPGAGDDEIERATAAVRRARTLLSELGAPAPVVADLGAAAEDDVEGERLWRLCAMAPLTALDAQKLLESADDRSRAALLTELCLAMATDLALLLGGGAQQH